MRPIRTPSVARPGLRVGERRREPEVGFVDAFLREIGRDRRREAAVRNRSARRRVSARHEDFDPGTLDDAVEAQRRVGGVGGSTVGGRAGRIGPAVSGRCVDDDDPPVGRQVVEQLVQAARQAGPPAVGQHDHAAPQPNATFRQPVLPLGQCVGAFEVQQAAHRRRRRRPELDVPEAALVPVGRVVPVGPVDQRVQADAADRDRRGARARHFVGDLVQPGGSPTADVSGLGQDHRPAVAPPGVVEQGRERLPTRVAQVPPEALLGADFPLPAGVVVDAEQVECGRRAAERRFGEATQQVPGLPLVRAHRVGERLQVGAVGRRDDVDDRLDVEEARAPVDRAHRVDAGQRRADQPALDVVAARGGACRRHRAGAIAGTGASAPSPRPPTPGSRSR